MKTYGNDRATTFGISSSLIDAVNKVTSGQPIDEEKPEDKPAWILSSQPAAKSKPQQLDEDMSIHVSPHDNGTHHVVKKVGSKMKKHGGIKVGEKLSDTEVDDAKDSGIKVHHESTEIDEKLTDDQKSLVKKALNVGSSKDPIKTSAPVKAAINLAKMQKTGNQRDQRGRVASEGVKASNYPKSNKKRSGDIKEEDIDETTGPGWWKTKPDEHMSKAYWQHSKIPPIDKKIKHENYQKIVKSLHKRNPAPKQEYDKHMKHYAENTFHESGMGRVAYQKQSGESGTGLDTFKKKPARQMKNPKKETMVHHPDHGVRVIDKKDEKKHLTKGWTRAEAFDPENIDLLDEGFTDAIDNAIRTLDSVTFERRYGHSKSDMKKRLQGVSAIGSSHKVRREDVSHPEFGKGMFIEIHDDERLTVMFGDGIKEVDLDDIDEWYIDGESVAVPLSEKKHKKLDRIDTKGLEGEWDDRDDKDVDNDGDEDRSDEYLHKRRKKIKKSMKEWAQDTIINKMVENPSRTAADAYQLATHYYNMSKGIDEELLDKAATLYGTFLEMDPGLNPVFRFESMDKILEARKGGGAAVGETERSGHRVTKTEKEGPEHIAMQLRKVQSLTHAGHQAHSGVDFNDGSKTKVKPHHATAALTRYDNARPSEKEELQKHMAHSHGALKHVASGKPLDSSPAAKSLTKKSSSGIKSSARLEPTRDLVHPTQNYRP